ncbi:MAG: CAP domain-containing protein [Flavobacteriaceae bacterium]
MKTIAYLFVVAALPLMFFSCSSESIDDAVNNTELNLSAPEEKAIEKEILVLINTYRQDLGLNSLSDLEIVRSVAFSHTDYMVKTNDVSHANFHKRSEYLMENASADKVSENVAYGYTSAETVVKAWIASEGHKANIVGDYTDFGLSAEQDVNGKWYFTNIFIKK